MRFIENHPAFERAIRCYFTELRGKRTSSICCVSAYGATLGGCAYMHKGEGEAEAFLLGLAPEWATQESFQKIREYPFRTLGLKRVTARVRSGSVSEGIAKTLGGEFLNGEFVFTEAILERGLNAK